MKKERYSICGGGVTPTVSVPRATRVPTLTALLARHLMFL